MNTAGAKRTSDLIAGGAAQADAKRLKLSGEENQPKLNQLPRLWRLEGLPPEVFSHVVGFLDLQTYRALFEVSGKINALVGQSKPFATERFRHGVDLDAFIGGASNWSANAALMVKRFGCAYHLLNAMGPLDELLRLAKREDVGYLRLDVTNGQINLDTLLTELDTAVGCRQRGGKAEPPSCHLVLHDLIAFDLRAGIERVLKGLKHVKIVSLYVFQKNQLALTSYMPALQQLSVDFGVELGPDHVLNVLASRKEPIPRLWLRGLEWNGEPSPRFFKELARLGVRHVWHKPYGPLEAAWKACKLESMELNLTFDSESLLGVRAVLNELALKALVLNEDMDEPTDGADLGIIAPSVRSDTSLQRLEVKAGATPRSGESELLLAVLHNPNIRYASLPYTLDKQKFVDRVMKADGRIIRQNNNLLHMHNEFEAICQKIEAANPRAAAEPIAAMGTAPAQTSEPQAQPGGS